MWLGRTEGKGDKVPIIFLLSLHTGAQMLSWLLLTPTPLCLLQVQ